MKKNIIKDIDEREYGQMPGEPAYSVGNIAIKSHQGDKDSKGRPLVRFHGWLTCPCCKEEIWATLKGLKTEYDK